MACGFCDTRCGGHGPCSSRRAFSSAENCACALSASAASAMKTAVRICWYCARKNAGRAAPHTHRALHRVSRHRRALVWRRAAVGLSHHGGGAPLADAGGLRRDYRPLPVPAGPEHRQRFHRAGQALVRPDRKSTRLNSSHSSISYAVFCLKKKKKKKKNRNKETM